MSLTFQGAFYEFFWHCRAKDRKSSFLCNPLPYIFFNSKLSETSKGPVPNIFSVARKVFDNFFVLLFFMVSRKICTGDWSAPENFRNTKRHFYAFFGTVGQKLGILQYPFCALLKLWCPTEGQCRL